MPAPVINLTINGRFLSQATTGVQRVARELTREFDRLIVDGEGRFRMRLLCPSDANLSDLRLRRIEVETVEGGHGAWWEQVALPRAVGTDHLLCLGNTAPVRSLLRRAPVTVMIHDLSYRYFPQAYRRRYRISHGAILPLLLRRADLIVTVSESECAMLRRIAPGVSPRIVVAQNGGWRSSGRGRDRGGGAGAEPGYALYVGSFSNRKNFDGLVRAAARLTEEDGLRFVFVGSHGSFLSPTRSDLRELARADITMTGQIESLAALGDIYRGAACLLFPSFYEASPLPPYEAMHFGVPVVVSDIPSMRERCGDAAQYCDPSDIDSIVGGVRRVMNDPVRRAELVAKGIERARIWSWRAQARTILDAVADAHARRGGPAGDRRA